MAGRQDKVISVEIKKIRKIKADENV